MTTPKLKTFKRNGSRFYVHPDKKIKAVPGVTSIIDHLPKPWMGAWAAKEVATVAVDTMPSWVGIAWAGDKQGAIDYLKRAPYRNTSSAAEVGDEIHSIFEKMAKGEKIGRVHPNEKPFVDNLKLFFERCKPEFLFVESSVWSETHEYAGSFDCICRIKGSILEQDEDETILIDVKTTRSGIHENVAIQLNAYAKADYILEANGDQIALPKLTSLAALHVRPEQSTLVPVAMADEIFQVFLNLKAINTWEKELKHSVIGDPVMEFIGGED